MERVHRLDKVLLNPGIKDITELITKQIKMKLDVILWYSSLLTVLVENNWLRASCELLCMSLMPLYNYILAKAINIMLVNADIAKKNHRLVDNDRGSQYHSIMSRDRNNCKQLHAYTFTDNLENCAPLVSSI